MSDDDLDARTGSSSPDAYQAEHMARDALYYDKIRAPLAYHLLFLLPLLVMLGTAFVGRTPLALSIVNALVLLTIWALFAALRITVTKGEVFVQYGLFGPKIAVRDIERCEAVDYEWKKYGGWGIRFARDGSVAYNMIGDGGRAVRIVYKKGQKTKTVLVASREPERLAAAIQAARAAAIGGAPATELAPLRVEAPATGEGEAEAEAAADDEAARALHGGGVGGRDGVS